MPPEQQTINPLGLTRPEFLESCRAAGIGSGRAVAAYHRVFREGRLDGLPGPVAAPVGAVVRRLGEETPEGTTVKFCQQIPRDAGAYRGKVKVEGGEGAAETLETESVVIPMLGRTGRKTHTLCVSSQVGCAMGCRFCETAQMGLIRHLTAEEIVGQWWAAEHVVRETIPGVAAPDPAESKYGRLARPLINNIVFMGMGEPLDNIDEVLRAIAVLTDHHGPGLPMSNITISTVGRVDGLRRILEVIREHGWKRLGLALSVNASNDAVRDGLMPVNRRWDMAELQRVMVELCEARGGRKMLFEYVLIPGVNDAPEHADELAEWLRPFMRTDEHGHIGLLNLIPYNPRRDSPWPAPTEEAVAAFLDRLIERGVFVKRRRTKGRTQMAACGQLGNPEIRRRKFVGLTASGRPTG